MVLIIGEVYHNQVRICLLESTPNTWYGHGKRIHVPEYRPVFLTLDIDEDPFPIKFTSASGKVRRGSVRRKPQTAWVVACNNRHCIRKCDIHAKLKKDRSDLIFHLGDQIYADRIYWRWHRYLSQYKNLNQGILQGKIEIWERYRHDIEMEYYREYWETWTPLANLLSHSSNVMIPDDHEMKDQAVTYSLEEDVSQLDMFIFDVALTACRKLYLGLRLTNTQRFDYIRDYGDITVIMEERVTHPFGESELNQINTDRMKSKILWLGSIPPIPIRSNIWEDLFYQSDDFVPDERYDQLYQRYSGKECIFIGGDLHIGAHGYIQPKNMSTKNKFHIVGPMSGFCSIYIPQKSLGSTSQHETHIHGFNPSSPNAVKIDLNKFETSCVFEPAGFVDFWQNLLSTAFHFWA